MSPGTAAIEGEDRHAGPAHIFAAGWDAEHLPTMIAVKAHFAADEISLFDQRKDVSGLIAECCRHPVDIAWTRAAHFHQGAGFSTRSGLRKHGLIDLTQCAGNCAFMMVPIGAHAFEATALR
jgi:hypothetical protein